LQTSGDQLYPTKGHDASHPLVLTQTVHSYQNIHVLLEHQPVYMWCSTVSSTSLPCLRVILVRLQTFLLCGFFTASFLDSCYSSNLFGRHKSTPLVTGSVTSS
jgi:hypothetical protein